MGLPIVVRPKLAMSAPKMANMRPSGIRMSMCLLRCLRSQPETGSDAVNGVLKCLQRLTPSGLTPNSLPENQVQREREHQHANRQWTRPLVPRQAAIVRNRRQRVHEALQLLVAPRLRKE